MTKPNHYIWPIRTHYTFVSTNDYICRILTAAAWYSGLQLLPSYIWSLKWIKACKVGSTDGSWQYCLKLCQIFLNEIFSDKILFTSEAIRREQQSFRITGEIILRSRPRGSTRSKQNWLKKSLKMTDVRLDINNPRSEFLPGQFNPAVCKEK